MPACGDLLGDALQFDEAGARRFRLAHEGADARNPRQESIRVNSRKARLAVIRLMPKLSTSSFSDGTRAPGAQAPERICKRM